MEASLVVGKLQKGREKRGIAVRVVRKWIVKDNNGQGAPLHVGLVLADAAGDAIYAEIPKDHIETKSYLLEIGFTYLIKKFRVNSCKTYYRPFDAPVMIEVTAFTTVEFITNPPATIPHYVYRITPFSAIVPASGAVFKYTDAIGYIARYSSLSSFVPKNKEKVTILREIYLKDLSDNEMKVTLWGDHAVQFSVDGVYDKGAGNVVVCLIVGCIPRRLYTDHSKSYLSGSCACAYYLNPDIPEAAPYYSRFKETPIYIDCPLSTEDELGSQTQDSPLLHKTISELNEIDPFDFEEGTYKCTVTIVAVAKTANWWYRSCVPCKKKVEQQSDRRYRCPKCFGYDIIPRYLLSFIAKDDTGEANFFAYDEEARLIVQKDCDVVVASLGSNIGLPQPLQRICGKTYTFGIDLTDDSCRGPLNRQYLIKSVLQRPNRESVALDAADSAVHTPGVANTDANLISAGLTTAQGADTSGLLAIEPVKVSTPATVLQSDSHTKKNTPSSSSVTSNVRRKLFESENMNREGTLSDKVPEEIPPPSDTVPISVDAITNPMAKRSKITASDPTSKKEDGKDL